MTDMAIASLDNGTTVSVKYGKIHIHVPAQFKKRIGRKQIVSPDRPESQGPLVTQLVRAFKWRKMLDDGVYSSTRELAKRLNLNESYVAMTIRFTLLAPDIIEAILDGKETSGLSVAALRKISSATWEEQRRELGFATS